MIETNEPAAPGWQPLPPWQREAAAAALQARARWPHALLITGRRGIGRTPESAASIDERSCRRWRSHCSFCLGATASLRLAALSIALSQIVRSSRARSQANADAAASTWAPFGWRPLFDKSIRIRTMIMS